MTITREHPVRTPGTAARRAGYLVAILVNAALLWLVNVSPGWQALPFLTNDLTEALPAVNAAMVIGIVADVVYIGADPPWLRAVGDIVVTSVGIVALVVLWRTFPFDFAGQTFDWEVLVRALLVLGIAGSAIAVVVNLVRLVGGTARRSGTPSPVHGAGPGSVRR